MARIKAFDPDEALERSMQAFWAHGYEATSTQDLERALGINRSSMYATFGSKSELYAKALERYAKGLRGPGFVRGMLEIEVPLRDRVERMLWSLVDDDLSAKRSRGCFAVNAAVELGPDDERVRRLVGESFDGARMVLRQAFSQAQHAGELRKDADVDSLSDMLVAVMEGLHVLCKGTRDRRFLGQAIAGSVSVI